MFMVADSEILDNPILSFQIIERFEQGCAGMDCPKRQFENREGARFCKKCGATLERKSPSRGSPYDQDSVFCDECGQDLRKPVETAPIDYSQPQCYINRALESESLLNTTIR